MNRIKGNLWVIGLILLLTGCSSLRYGGRLSQPPEAHITLPNTILNDFDADGRAILMRYFAGNGRWEVRTEGDIIYAIRLEEIDGKYRTTLNGYYSHGGGHQQTRVLVSFEQPYSTLMNDRGQFTKAKAGEQNVSVTVEDPYPGTPGHSSYTIIEGVELFLEIYDQSSSVERRFSQQAFEEVSAELSDVLAHQNEIKLTGVLPIASRYPAELPQAAYFKVLDGIQPGIYVLDAAVNPTLPGTLFAKVYNVETGAQLSAKYIAPSSTRIAAWSEGGATFFPYQAEITVYEGDWEHEYEARFELWHRDEAGQEAKLLETTRVISGWES